MPINALSPAFIKVYYSSPYHTHVQTLPVRNSGTTTPGAEPNLRQKDATAVSMGTWAGDYQTIIAPLFTEDVSFSVAEFWLKLNPDDDPIYIWSQALGFTGSQEVALPYPDGMLTMSLRSQSGGIGKFTLMESAVSPLTRDAYPFTATALAALGDWLTGDTATVVARDNGYFVAPFKATGKTNDALRKRRLSYS